MAPAPLTERSIEGVMDRAVEMALLHSLRAALESDVAYDAAPSIAVAHARILFEKAVNTFFGSRRSTLRLPTELFVEVLTYLDTKDLIPASHVSRHWRSILLATPRLWSFISSYSIKTHISGVLSSLLERSQDAPLTLDLVATNENALEIAPCLIDHLHHVKYLSLHMKMNLLTSLRGSLSLALETPAPILRAFKIWDSQAVHRDTRGPTCQWFDGRAPLLSRVKLHIQPDLLRKNAGFRHTRRLFLSSAVRDVSSALTTIVHLFPQLDTLAVTVDSASSLAPMLPAETLRRLGNLRQLLIIVNGRSTSVSPILPWLSRLNTPHITISWQLPSRRQDSVSQAIAAMTNNFPGVESLSIHYADGLNLDFRGADGAERTFLEVPHALRPGAAVFSQLTSLAVSELAWTQGDLLPPAPALTDLRVFLLRPYSHLPAADETGLGYDTTSVFLLREHRALACPALRRVALVVRCYNCSDPTDEPTVVAPLLMREFLRDQLAYQAPVLDTLALVGFQLLQNPVDEVARLFAMARDVEIDPHQPSDLRPTSDVLSWNWP